MKSLLFVSSAQVFSALLTLAFSITLMRRAFLPFAYTHTASYPALCLAGRQSSKSVSPWGIGAHASLPHSIGHLEAGGQFMNIWLQTKLYTCVRCGKRLLHDRMPAHVSYHCKNSHEKRKKNEQSTR